MKQLNELISCNDTRVINALMLDSREKKENSIFFCIEGLTVDAHDFVEQAIDNGAVAIIHRKDIHSKREDVFYYQVDDVQAELHQVANAFYDYPSKDIYVYGVTGTDGKSTMTKTIQNILQSMGVKAGYIGTISVEYNNHAFESDLTTPDIVSLNHWLNEMRSENVTDVCLEVSSQGLSMRRVEGIDFSFAAFTNLTHDHLDFHKTMENYFKAKKVLFDLLPEDRPMFINVDDPYGKRIVNEYPKQAITYGVEADADYLATNIEIHEDYTSYTLVHKGIEYPVKTNLLAMFNVYNTLAIIAMLHHRGFAIETIIAHMVELPPVEGRVIEVEEGQGFRVYVDYSHTPGSIQNLYEFVRSTLLPNQKLISVLGATGNRDQEKRPKMGRIATEICDYVIFTEDDSHQEKVELILEDVLSGVAKDNYEIILDRDKAIEKAIELANDGDAIVITGKGEEKFIYRNEGRVPWTGDDVVAKQAIIKKEEEKK